MINYDRIVPIQKIDFLSLIGTILELIGTTYTVLETTTIEGAFAINDSGAAGNFLCNQPVQSLDFGEATSATVYFVAAYDYSGIMIDSLPVSPGMGSVTVNPDGITLYKAVLDDGDVTITAVTPV